MKTITVVNIVMVFLVLAMSIYIYISFRSIKKQLTNLQPS